MLRLNISGSYQVEGSVPLQLLEQLPQTKGIEPTECHGQILLLQVGDFILGRGHLIHHAEDLKSQNAESRGLSGWYLDFQGRIVRPVVQIQTVEFEGRCISRGATKSHASVSDVRGVIFPVEESIELSLGQSGVLGKLRLFNWFFIGDITENEIWYEFFKDRLLTSKPWSLLLSHEKLQSPLARYLRQSEFERNVFIMIRFQTTRENKMIREVISRTLKDEGLIPQFADNLSVADDLWENVCAYMLGSKFGIAVIEQIEERSFNPNVAIEIGFMLALQRKVLVLKDKRVPRLPADLIGRIYREFDSYQIEDTVATEIRGWVEELRMLGEIPPKHLYPILYTDQGEALR
ncbi:MAG: hypothetical protein HY741_21770 [Chloroflexi bacterium]|nr:hypothetical protein [Chloroflexota bacterium]